MKTQNLYPIIQKAALIAIVAALVTPVAFSQNRRKSTTETTKQEIKYRRPSQIKVDIQDTPSLQRKGESHEKNKKQYEHTFNYQADQTHFYHKKQKSAHYHDYWTTHHHHNHGVHLNYNHQLKYRNERPAISFRELPKKAVWVRLNGESYYIHKDRFYQHSPYGYYRVKPPKFVENLPVGHSIMWVNGQKIYNYRGVLFINTPFGFKIITA